jgi:hypothetical protein
MNGYEATAGPNEAPSLSKKWYTAHVRTLIYSCCTAYVAYRPKRGVSVNEIIHPSIPTVSFLARSAWSPLRVHMLSSGAFSLSQCDVTHTEIGLVTLLLRDTPRIFKVGE